MSLWVKDPGDIASYTFNWGGDSTTNPPTPPFLAPGETITTHTTTVDSNLTKVSDSATSTTVSVKVSGGTNGSQSLVTCQVVTSAANTWNVEKYIIISTRVS